MINDQNLPATDAHPEELTDEALRAIAGGEKSATGRPTADVKTRDQVLWTLIRDRA
jgi:hypothetical protein